MNMLAIMSSSCRDRWCPPTPSYFFSDTSLSWPAISVPSQVVASTGEPGRLEGVPLGSLEPLEARHFAAVAVDVPQDSVVQQPAHGLLAHSKRREVQGAVERIA